MAGALANQNSNTVAIIESNFARVQPAQVVSDTAAKIAVTPSGPPQPLQFTNFAPATVLENVRHAIRQYGDMFGGNPVGTNAGNHQPRWPATIPSTSISQRRGRNARE